MGHHNDESLANLDARTSDDDYWDKIERQGERLPPIKHDEPRKLRVVASRRDKYQRPGDWRANYDRMACCKKIESKCTCPKGVRRYANLQGEK